MKNQAHWYVNEPLVTKTKPSKPQFHITRDQLESLLKQARERELDLKSNTKSPIPLPDDMNQSFYKSTLNIKHWFDEEFTFTMNLITIFALVTGLMILGALFFTMGFLAAVDIQPNHSPHSSSNQSSMVSNLNMGKFGNAIAKNLIVEANNTAFAAAREKILAHTPSQLEPAVTHMTNVLANTTQANLLSTDASQTRGRSSIQTKSHTHSISKSKE
jgi:hypothetical protein